MKFAMLRSIDGDQIIVLNKKASLACSCIVALTRKNLERAYDKDDLITLILGLNKQY